jgi:flagellar basal-body rod modification protein FlgD
MTTQISDLGLGTSIGMNGVMAPSAELGKEEFLQLLVSQLQHQNPLEPTNNEDFIAQLATFSSLEQLQDINTGTQTGLLMQQSLGNALSTSLIGRDVLLDTSAVRVEVGSSSDFLADLDADATLNVEIRNADDEVVRTITVNGEDGLPLLAGEHEIHWDGEDDDGKAVPDGDYSVSVSATDATGGDVGVSSWLRWHVDGVRFSQGTAYVIVGSMEFTLADVIEIREQLEAAAEAATTPSWTTG